jgi:hypothetical protein
MGPLSVPVSFPRVHFNDRLPSNSSLVTETGTTILQEFYVSNEETVIAVGYLILFAYIAKVRHSVLGCEFLFFSFLSFFLSMQIISLWYKEWAVNHIARIACLLNGARNKHAQAVVDHIDTVVQIHAHRGSLYHFQGPSALVRSPSRLIGTHRTILLRL